MSGAKQCRNSPVMERMCPTCPFCAKGLAAVRPLLMERALGEATPICHSTGDSDVVPPDKKLFQEERLCRGARKFQIEVFYRLGFIAAPTDEAWNAKRRELGMQPTK